MRLILVRHGQAEHRGDEEDNLYLTELGRRQVELLGQWLAENEPEITTIVSSPLRRARERGGISALAWWPVATREKKTKSRELNG